MDRLFLDANVLFSAAYRADAGVGKLWLAGDTVLVTSRYAVEEARRNLPNPEQRARLDTLLQPVEVVSSGSVAPEDRGEITLPDKDWPILGGAVTSGATHLITGDLRDFGSYFGQHVLGVLVQTPAQYLRERSACKATGADAPT